METADGWMVPHCEGSPGVRSFKVQDLCLKIVDATHSSEHFQLMNQPLLAREKGNNLKLERVVGSWQPFKVCLKLRGKLTPPHVEQTPFQQYWLAEKSAR